MSMSGHQSQNNMTNKGRKACLNDGGCGPTKKVDSFGDLTLTSPYLTLLSFWYQRLLSGR